MKISDLGLQLIKTFESLHDGDLSKIGLQPKQDPVGIFTIGYGHALAKPGGGWIKDIDEVEQFYPQFMNIDEETADSLLIEDLESRENAINSLGLQLEQCQFDALVSFIYNVGFGNLQSSTRLKRIEADAEPYLIYDAFLMWNKAGGVPLKGLTRRRKAEATLFNTGKLNLD